MTPQTQAKDLLVRMYNMIFDIDLGKNVSHDGKRYQAAKQCAIICVDQMIREISDNYDTLHAADRIRFYQSVKIEIIKL